MRKKAKAAKAKMCSIWPHCHCIMRGYVNHRERDSCGRKPKAADDARPTHRVSFIDQLLHV